MKKIKLCSFVVLGFLAVSPALASENWLENLFPWLTLSGGGAGGGNPGVDPVNASGPIYVPQGPGGGHPGVDPVNASGPIYVPQGGGAGGGDPGVDPE